MRNAFLDALFPIAKDNKDIVLMTGDLGYGVLTRFWEELPGQFINAGISEQNMASVAAGMAMEGKTVFTYSIANFPTLRCLEQIRNDIAYHGANVKIVSVGGGFAYGQLGMSHHATEDIAIMRALPGMTIFAPCDPLEVAAVTKLAADMNGPCYIRLGKGGERRIHADIPALELGRALPLREGKDAAILTAGAIADAALDAAAILKDKAGIGCAVWSFPTVKPIDTDAIRKISHDHGRIFTLEEHNTVGGFGGAVAEVLSELPAHAALTRIGLADTYTSVVGTQEWLRGYYGINAGAVAERIEGLCK